ncbi:metallophosphoesterase family protein [Phenylobacterium deserti]|uniref:Serine/threonine protein phosphatase n=1 Tax=Phenylobacterium deserti TaxID=1914756 RepID=A0A328AQ69_9CAUL|nr:metallophosphoesterase family protein [Phenylobacterium deserti]RAK57153.1 serine/threonine protein phosphatase [Phenylobacterium deserti]
MFSRLLGQKRSREVLPSTGGRLVYAVGDVHGRLDVLQMLVRDIANDVLATRPPERPVLIFLGDYVDRGPDSRGVVDLILTLKSDPAFDVTVLKGNHEEALMQFVQDPGFGSTWLDHGGGATLAAYGVQPPSTRMDSDTWAATRDALNAALPASHRAFYQQLELMRVVGDYAFVHAGVRPGVALEDQSERDLLWIRHEFIRDRGPFGKVIVHGHTPSEEAQLTPCRIGIDTGAYATGVLTAVRLYGDSQSLIQARSQRRIG